MRHRVGMLRKTLKNRRSDGSWQKSGDWIRAEPEKLLKADGATVGPTAGASEAKAGIDAIEDDSVGFYFPRLFLQGFFHGVFGVPEEDLGGADEGDDLIFPFGAIEE